MLLRFTLVMMTAACLAGCVVERTVVRNDEVNQLIEEESPASLNR